MMNFFFKFNIIWPVNQNCLKNSKISITRWPPRVLSEVPSTPLLSSEQVQTDKRKKQNKHLPLRIEYTRSHVVTPTDLNRCFAGYTNIRESTEEGEVVSPKQRSLHFVAVVRSSATETVQQVRFSLRLRHRAELPFFHCFNLGASVGSGKH